MQNCVSSGAVILLERDDKAGEIVAADLVDRLVIFEELKKTFEHAFVFAVRVRLSKGLYLAEVLPNGDMKRWFLGFFASGFEARNPKPAAFQFMALSSLCFESLSSGNASRSAPALSTGAPLNEVLSFGKAVRAATTVDTKPSKLLGDKGGNRKLAFYR